MFFAELPLVLLRRWYLVVLGVLLSGVLAGGTFQSVSPTYQARAEILLLPPSTSVPKGGNPYLVLGGLEAIGGVLSTALSDQATTAELKAQGASGDFSIGLDQTSPAPLLEVITESTTAADSLSTLQLVVDRIPPTMEEIQRAADVTPGSYITTTPITTTQKPEVLRKAQLRVVVVVTAVGFALTLLLTAAIDGLLVRRRVRRRGPDSEAGAEAESGARAGSGAGSGAGTAMDGDHSAPGPDPEHRGADRPLPSAPAETSPTAQPRHAADPRAKDRPDRYRPGAPGRRETASDEDAEVLPARR